LIRIMNFSELVSNTSLETDRRARQYALEILGSALTSSDPVDLVKRKLYTKDNLLLIDSLKFDLNRFDRILVVGAGKASGAMASAVEDIFGDRISKGLINVQKGIRERFDTKHIELNEARHPVPDEGGLLGSKKILKVLDDVSENDLVISIISGGGSALLPLPAGDLSLSDMQDVTQNLLKCGATIDEVNMVRKHLSAIKGGRLAKHTYPATMICLIISDVVGDPLSSIASGPTVPDPSTYSDAYKVLKRYDVWDSIPEVVKTHINKGLTGEIPESPKPEDPYFKKVHNIILGSNRIALKAASDKAGRLGLTPYILTSYIEGEARHVGTVIASLARETTSEECFFKKPTAILAGGETTVTVRGEGRGGRNQELALSASLKIKEQKGMVILSAGTDGLDGPTDAAGAIVDGSTLRRAQERDMNPIDYLDNNDSYNFFKNIGDLVLTGSTGTNVNDILIIVAI